MFNSGKNIDTVRLSYVGFCLFVILFMVWLLRNETGFQIAGGSVVIGATLIGCLYPEIVELAGIILHTVFYRGEFEYTNETIFEITAFAKPQLLPEIKLWCKQNLKYPCGIVKRSAFFYFAADGELVPRCADSTVRPVTLWFISRSDSLLFKMRWS